MVSSRGFTHEISASGLFISCPNRPGAGVIASVEIYVPSRHPFGKELRLHGTGRVVRWVENGTKNGFVVSSTVGWAIDRSVRQLAHVG
jgi:hypothetical protein